MAEQFNYSSVLAPYINRLLEMKTSAGYSAHRLKWILKEFDDFAISVKLTIPCITEEFIAQWRKRRNADCERTIYAKYSAWHMLTTMMSRCGLSCFIPRLPKQPKVVFTAYVFTEQQVGKIFEVADNMRLYDIRMGTALIAYPLSCACCTALGCVCQRYYHSRTATLICKPTASWSGKPKTDLKE